MEPRERREPGASDVASVIHAAFDATLPAVPLSLSERALAAFRMRPADPVAELRSDSATQDQLTIRGLVPPRRMQFVAGEMEARVVIERDTVRVTVVPAGPFRCRVETTGSVSHHVAADDGEVVVRAVALPVRIRVETARGAFVTTWIVG